MSFRTKLWLVDLLITATTIFMFYVLMVGWYGPPKEPNTIDYDRYIVCACIVFLLVTTISNSWAGFIDLLSNYERS